MYQSELTEFLAELTEFDAELSEVSLQRTAKGGAEPTFPPGGGANRTANSPRKGPKPEEIISEGGGSLQMILHPPSPEGYGDLHPSMVFSSLF